MDAPGRVYALHVTDDSVNELEWQQSAPPERGYHWWLLERDHPDARAWLADQSQLPELVIDALLADDTRPRCTRVGDGLIVNLRGVNLNPGEDPADMVSLRLWLDEKRVIGTRLRRLQASADVRDALAHGHGPRSTAAFIADLTAALAAKVEPLLDQWQAAVGELEEDVESAEIGGLRHRMVELRRQILNLRRFIMPQRDALIRLATEELPWLGMGYRMQLRETADAITRQAEEFDLLRERLTVVNDAINHRASELLNARTYLFTVIAAVFLPLGFLTGLLGINVGGIPLAESPWGFGLICVVLAVLVALEVWWLRRRRFL